MTAAVTADWLLRAGAVTKRFGNLVALDRVSLEIRAGQVHALLGANGSGKSTLVKILSGALAPDEGELWLAGRRLAGFGSPAAAAARGIRVIHQEAPLIDSLTVLESVALFRGYGVRGPGRIRWRALRRDVADLLAGMDVAVSPDELCARVGPADRAGIALAIAAGDLVRAGDGAGGPGAGGHGAEGQGAGGHGARGQGRSARAARLLIVDEVTAAIPEAGAERHLRRLRKLADAGLAVVMVTHRMAELAIADDVTVLRAGQVAYRQGSSPRPPVPTLVREITGQEAAGQQAAGQETAGQETAGRGAAGRAGAAAAAPAASTAPVPAAGARRQPVQQLRSAMPAGQPDATRAAGVPAIRLQDVICSQLRGLTFSAQPGEVLGFAGLPQSGITELPQLLAGAVPRLGGVLEVAGAAVPRQAGPPGMLAAGMTTIPADRLRAGGVASLPVAENVLLPALARYWRRPALGRSLVSAVISAFDVRPADQRVLFGSLSGGNQQKVLLGKWLSLRPSVLVLEDPTYGVDPGAREIIFDAIADAARLGTCVLFFSTEPEQLVRVCSRVLALSGGTVARTLTGGGITLENVASWSYQ